MGVQNIPQKICTPKMPLTNAECKNAKPREKAYKLADGGGMFLLVHSNGSKYWRLKYRFAGKEKLLALGSYPQVSIVDARAKREAARKLLQAGHDPCEVKKEEHAKAVLNSETTFEAIAHEWHENKRDGWESNTA